MSWLNHVLYSLYNAANRSNESLSVHCWLQGVFPSGHEATYLSTLSIIVQAKNGVLQYEDYFLIIPAIPLMTSLPF